MKCPSKSCAVKMLQESSSVVVPADSHCLFQMSGSGFITPSQTLALFVRQSSINTTDDLAQADRLTLSSEPDSDEFVLAVNLAQEPTNFTVTSDAQVSNIRLNAPSSDQVLAFSICLGLTLPILLF